MAERAQHEPETGRGLALAWAGVDHQQSFGGDGLAGDLGVLHGLSLFHLGAMAGGFVLLVHGRSRESFGDIGAGQFVVRR